MCVSLYCWHPQSLIVLLLLFLPYKSLSQILKSHSNLGPPPLRPQLKNPPRFSIAISRVQKSLNVPVLSGPCWHRQPCLILCHSLLLTMSQHLWPLLEMQQAFAVCSYRTFFPWIWLVSSLWASIPSDVTFSELSLILSRSLTLMITLLFLSLHLSQTINMWLIAHLVVACLNWPEGKLLEK